MPAVLAGVPETSPKGSDMPVADPSDPTHLGLAHDLRALTRRRLFGMVARAAAGLSLGPAIAGCATTNPGAPAAADAGADGTGSTGSGSCTQIPQETGGPYPADGTNGPNALTASGIVRSDIRASFGSASAVAAGVPLSVTLTLLDAATCAPLAGRAVYLWHCDRDGNYSMYSSAVASENYLRGVQISDASGEVTFTTIVPGCYSGRWPHIHFEVYASASAATSGSNAIATSQLAMPKATCDAAYATTGYASSVTNLSRVSLATDMVFSDGATLELPTITGTAAAGYAAALSVAVAA
jgi:protocatechuate 3,4-dioxygenase beta subunit